MPPTRAEIASELGLNQPMRGRASESSGSQRRDRMMPGILGIQLLTEELEDEEEGLPLIGRVAAGEPILAQQNILKHITD